MPVLTDDQLAQFDEPLQSIIRQLDAEDLVTGLASGLRDVDAQAHAMAVNEVAGDAHGLCWVAGTYRGSPVEAAVVAALNACPQKDVAGYEEAISGALATPGLDLRLLSRHLPGPDGKASAADLLPAGPGPLASRATVLIKAAVQAGAHPYSCLLTNESGHTCTHLQVWTTG